MLNKSDKWIAYIKLSRPLNVLLTFISVWLAASISPGFSVSFRVLFAALSASFILAGANAINDIFDLEIDRINRPNRPLSGGVISVNAAWTFFSISYVAGLTLAAFCGVWLLLIALVTAVALILYSTHLKRTAVWGNGLVSVAAGLTFVYGAEAVHDWQAGVLPGLFAFFFHFGREVLKDMQDVKGDRKGEAWTLPAKYGFGRARQLIVFLFLLLIGVTLIPYIFSDYNSLYLSVLIIGVHSVLIYVVVLLNRQPDVQTLSKLSNLLKVDMFIGLLAVWIGAHHVTLFN